MNAWNRNLIPRWLLLPQGISGSLKRRVGYAPFKELRQHGVLLLGGEGWKFVKNKGTSFSLLPIPSNPSLLSVIQTDTAISLPLSLRNSPALLKLSSLGVPSGAKVSTFEKPPA